MTTRPDDRLDLVAQCRLMLRFARGSGADFPAGLQSQIALLDQMLRNAGLQPVAEVPQELVVAGPAPALADAGPPLSPTELILAVHGALSAVVAPATAESLESSELPPGARSFFGGLPPLVKYTAIIALVSAVAFVMSAGVIATRTARAATPATAPPPAGATQGGSRP